VIPRGLSALVDLDRVPVPPVFKWLAATSAVGEHEMLRTFNCGIGMIAVVDAKKAAAASEAFQAHGESVVRLGEVARAHGEARIDFRGRLDLAR
jgi:phosphoribosylformylglycinamidine cyclo-ligase